MQAIDIFRFFPGLSEGQKKQMEALYGLYAEWNSKINVISRKDIENLYLNHVLHSLAIARVIQFVPGTHVLDVGTGGGFPGIPLAILFPETRFHLVDSIGKKIKVVKAVSESIGLKNVEAFHRRAEELPDKYDFVVSRAVTRLDTFMGWVKGKFNNNNNNSLENGVLYLKGGHFLEELQNYKYQLHPVEPMFQNPFFADKYVVHIKS